MVWHGTAQIHQVGWLERIRIPGIPDRPSCALGGSQAASRAQTLLCAATCRVWTVCGIVAELAWGRVDVVKVEGWSPSHWDGWGSLSTKEDKYSMKFAIFTVRAPLSNLKRLLF